ncbi:hypothetical protein C1646_773360, partial [Rhizophagus diaphanus]
FDPNLNPVRSESELSSITNRSKFSPYGQKARNHLLVPGVLAKNADTWIKYVFREAYGLSGKTLGEDF